MRINTRPEVSKWTIIAKFMVDYDYGLGWRNIDIGIIKMHTKPEPGEMYQHRKHYIGFWFRAKIWLPIKMRSWL